LRRFLMGVGERDEGVQPQAASQRHTILKHVPQWGCPPVLSAIPLLSMEVAASALTEYPITFRKLTQPQSGPAVDCGSRREVSCMVRNVDDFVEH
jgi:hypothetical protein